MPIKWKEDNSNKQCNFVIPIVLVKKRKLIAFTGNEILKTKTETNSDNRVLKILPKINNIKIVLILGKILQTRIVLILGKVLRTWTIFHWQNTSYNTGVAVQDNAAQQWWYSTILTANTISNTGKFAKMVHPDFFGEDGGRSSHHSDLENQWLQVVDYDENTGNQNGKPFTLPYYFPNTQHIIITSIAFCQLLSMHHLQSTFN